MFLSPDTNILEDPEVELPPPKISTALPMSFRQIFSLLQNPVPLPFMHTKGDSKKLFEPREYHTNSLDSVSYIGNWVSTSVMPKAR